MSKYIKTIITLAILVVAIAFAVPVKTHAAASSCKASGCTRKPVPGPDRDGYCYDHSPKNSKCKASGCSRMAWYKTGKNAGYCEFHAGSGTSSKSYTKTTPKKSSSSYKSSSSSKKSYSSSKKSSSSKKYSMPDCDDYEDYDDFMDEWDGCMPDGSDAEDYWENW